MQVGFKAATRRTGVCLCLLLLAAALFAGCSLSDRNEPVQTSVGSLQGSSTMDPGGAAGSIPTGEDEASLYPAKATYSQSGDTKTEDGRTYAASEEDQSAILVTDGGSFTATNAIIETSGEASNAEASSFYGRNAAVVATTGSSIQLSGSSITTTGLGASGAFATGQGTTLSLTDVIIEATGRGARGVMATDGGSIALDDVQITTAGVNSAPLETGVGGGTIRATGGSAVALGEDSPALYSTGLIETNGGIYRATGAGAAVVEGTSGITLTGTQLASTIADKWGVMMYQRVPDEAGTTQGTFTMTGGSLSVTGKDSPLFYVTNSTGNINLSGVELECVSGIILWAAAGRWGTTGTNGGKAIILASGQALAGDLVADKFSSLSLTLEDGASLTGAINSGNTAGRVDVTLGATTVWKVTADSYLTTLHLLGGITDTTIENIIGNGHYVYYDASDPANGTLAGRTYDLAGGGLLAPLR